MRKAIALFLAIALAAGALAGCLQEDAGQPGVGGTYTPPAESTQSQLPQEEENGGALCILLPQGSENIRDILKEVAGKEGISADITVSNIQVDYTGQVQKALQEEDAPDIFMVNGETDARVLGTASFENLLAGKSSPALSALADMAPAQSRLIDKTRVYGLPLGYFAEGYLLDIDVMAALLGTTNKNALLNDLMACTFEQWSMMLEALEIYLQRPTAIRMKLGESTYTTPSYRDKTAQALRGIFATADGDGAALMHGAVGAACYAPYEDTGDWLSSSEDEIEENLFPTLESLYALMDYETMHMARKEGAVYRGEAYAVRDPLSEQEAAALFAEGTALLYRSDSQRAHTLQEEYPQLEGRLVMVPIKLPPPVLPEEEAEGEEEPAEETETEPTVSELVAEKIAEKNQKIWYGTGGYLCVNAKSENKKAAEALFLRLFTTEEGVQALRQKLNLQPFSELLPRTALDTQLSRIALGNGGNLLPAAPEALAGAEKQIGTFVGKELMDKTEWGEEEAIGFLTESLFALGYRMEIPLGLETA